VGSSFQVLVLLFIMVFALRMDLVFLLVLVVLVIQDIVDLVQVFI
jgi:hypothetical protein